MHPLFAKLTRLGLPALLIASGSQAANFPDYGISLLDIRGVLPHPVMEVSSTDGEEYSQAANKEVVFKVEAKARCENLHHVQYGQILIYPKGASTISDNYASDLVIGKSNLNKKTWANDWTPRSFHFMPNASLKNNAVQACNAELNKRAGQGGNKANILKAGFETTMKKTTNQFNFTCGGPSPWSGHPKSVENVHPITVKCGAYTQKLAVLKPVSIPTFKLVDADISMKQTHYQGSCPAGLPVEAMIGSNDLGGSFEYRFLEDGKAVAGWKQKTVAKGQSNTLLTHTLTIKPPRAKSSKGSKGFQGGIQNKDQANAQVIPQMQQVPLHKVSIEVRRDTQQLSDVQSYQATCKTVTIGVATMDPKPGLTPLADLTSRAGVTIGLKSSAWGGQLMLDQSDFTQTTPRGCFARFRYDVVNMGAADATGFNSRLRLSGKQAHLETNMELNKNQSKNVSGSILLPAGNYPITAAIDDGKTIEESNENNNTFMVTVTVPESCGGGTAPRPTGSASPIPGTPPTAMPNPAGAVPMPNPTGAVPMPNPAGAVPMPRPTGAVPTAMPRPAGTSTPDPTGAPETPKPRS